MRERFLTFRPLTNSSLTLKDGSNVQLGEITARFNELYAKAGGAKGVVVDREAFSQYLNLPVAIGDRLFEAFDEKKNGSICLEEFICGLAIVIHGSFRDRCGLLFRVFNIGNDEGVSREELRTMLTAILQSTNTILYTVGHTDRAVLGGEDMQETITAMVQAAFANCDISRTGKLLPMEFEYWLKRNPKILDTLLSFKTQKDVCTLGSLIMSPSEQKLQSSPRPQGRSPPSQRRGSRGGQSPRPPLTGGQPLFKVGSEQDSLTQMSASQSRVTSDLQGSMEKLNSSPQPPAGGQPGEGKVFQVGGDEGSLDSLQMSASSALQSIGIETQEAPTDSGCDQEGGVVRGGESVIETTDGGMLRDQEGIEIQEAAEVAMDPGSDQVPAEKEPSTALTMEQDGGSEPSVVVMVEGDEGEVQSTALTMKEGEGRDLSVALSMEGGEKEEPTTEEGEKEGTSVIINLEDQSESLEEKTQVGSAVLEEGEESASIPRSSSSVPLDSAQGPGLMAGGREEEHRSAGDVSRLGLAGDGLVSGGGSIMASASDISINISAVPQVQSQVGPASPVLPIQEEVVMGGARLEDGAASPGVEVGKEEVEESAGIMLGVQLSETCALTGETVVVAATPPSQQPMMPLPSPPRGRVSPFQEEAEGFRCSESICQAWVLSKWTRDLLGHPQPGTHLTCPALMSDINLTDGISELLSAHYPDQPRRSLLTVDQVSMDAIGLRRLVSSGSLHAALELTARFLSAHGQGLGQAGQPTIHTHKTLQMWSARMSLLLQLRLYKEAELELRAFGEMLNPDLYYQYHTSSYPGMKGSLVPFTLRLLHATLPRHTGDSQLALDRLCRLQQVCEQILSEAGKGRLPDVTEPLSSPDKEVAENLWMERLCRTKCCLANTLITVQDYGMAMRLYEEVAEQQSAPVRLELLSGVGRLYLQLGDMRTASSYFERVESEMGEARDQSPLVKINEGYLNVFLSRWQTARDCFKAALTFDPSNLVIQSNITVCTFYMGRLKESIRDMEQLLTSDPPASLQPALFANLATTYELESGSSSWKKLAYIPLLGQHIGQGTRHLAELNIR